MSFHHIITHVLWSNDLYHQLLNHSSFSTFVHPYSCILILSVRSSAKSSTPVITYKNVIKENRKLVFRSKQTKPSETRSPRNLSERCPEWKVFPRADPLRNGARQVSCYVRYQRRKIQILNSDIVLPWRCFAAPQPGRRFVSCIFCLMSPRKYASLNSNCVPRGRNDEPGVD